MLAKRIIPCLDVRNGKVVKGVNFEGIKDVGDPVECAFEYNKQGADEIVFYDITASFSNHKLASKALSTNSDKKHLYLFEELLDFSGVNYSLFDEIYTSSNSIKAAFLRFRAIMMTEAAFILGILPLLFASGAGANSRISVGSTVIGGMIVAATIGTVLTPAFYVVIQEVVDKYFNNKKDEEYEI